MGNNRSPKPIICFTITCAGSSAPITDIYFDYLELIDKAVPPCTAIPSFTPTRTPTRTPSKTPTVTNTATPTMTFTPTKTPTPTLTPTAGTCTPITTSTPWASNPYIESFINCVDWSECCVANIGGDCSGYTDLIICDGDKLRFAPASDLAFIHAVKSFSVVPGRVYSVAVSVKTNDRANITIIGQVREDLCNNCPCIGAWADISVDGINITNSYDNTWEQKFIVSNKVAHSGIFCIRIGARSGASAWALIDNLFILDMGLPTPTATPSPYITSTPTATPTFTPTITPTPSMTPTMTPTTTPFARIITVCQTGGCDYTSLTAAMNNAKCGDVIYIRTGLYDNTTGEVFPINIKAGTRIMWSGPNAYPWISFKPILTSNNTSRLINCIDTGMEKETIIENIDFESGSVQGDGGAIYIENSVLWLKHCIMYDNTASRAGGAIFALNSTVYAEGCKITQNNCIQDGGAVYLYNSNGWFSNCFIDRNNAIKGSGMMVHTSNAKIENCTFADNVASDEFSGSLDCYYRSNATITNSIFWGGMPREIYQRDSIIEVIYSDIKNSYPGTGNIDIDPIFTIGSLEYPYYIQPSSPCIDAGFNLSHLRGDWRTFPRPAGSDYDIGAHEYWNPFPAPMTPTPTATPGGCD